MKLIALFLGCLCCLSSSFASTRHSHPQTNTAATQNMTWAGNCEVEIINQSYMDVQVFGVFDDGADLDPFNIYSFSPAHYISLYYNGYCHAGIDLDIDTFTGYHVFGYYVRRGTTVLIVPDMMNRLRATIRN